MLVLVWNDRIYGKDILCCILDVVLLNGMEIWTWSQDIGKHLLAAVFFGSRNTGEDDRLRTIVNMHGPEQREDPQHVPEIQAFSCVVSSPTCCCSVADSCYVCSSP